MLKIIKKILNLGDHVRTWKYKNIFAKSYSPNWSDKVSLSKKLKILWHRHMLLVILTVKKSLGSFTKKNFKWQIKQSLELKKYFREKVINYMTNGMTMIII